MKNYRDMSDEQLSSELMVVIHGEEVKHWELSADGKSIYHCGPTGEGFYELQLIDINNPSDIMPIAIQDSISIEWDFDISDGQAFRWCNAYSMGKTVVINHQSNPYRAIAICFLNMKDALLTLQ